MVEGRFSLTATRVQRFLMVTLGLLALAFVLAMFSDRAVSAGKELLGVASKRDLLTFLAVGMGGLLVALQAVMSYKRAKAMEETASAQVVANRNMETGQRQQRLRDAIKHLGHDSDSVRLGGAYELLHLAKDTEDMRETVLKILCAHIRRTTRENEYQEQHAASPSEEIQTLLTLLFVDNPQTFGNDPAELQGSWLNGAYLDRARLQFANLSHASLHSARLTSVKLQGSVLVETQLQRITAPYAQLDGSDMSGVQLQHSLLVGSSMRGSNLHGAQLQLAHLNGVELQGALLSSTGMQEADCSQIQMQGVSPKYFFGTPSARIREYVDVETDLSEVIFSGGLTEESLQTIVKRLPDAYERSTRRRLSEHVGKPASSDPPPGVITGSYDREEAEALAQPRARLKEGQRWACDGNCAVQITRHMGPILKGFSRDASCRRLNGRARCQGSPGRADRGVWSS